MKRLFNVLLLAVSLVFLASSCTSERPMVLDSEDSLKESSKYVLNSLDTTVTYYHFIDQEVLYLVNTETDLVEIKVENLYTTHSNVTMALAIAVLFIVFLLAAVLFRD